MGKIKKSPITSKKGPKVTKGGPSGLVISLILHAAAFFVAGLFVVFTVLAPQEPEFEAPPPVQRPKMKLKKPKVKIKKSSQPKPSSRIVAKVKTAKMPEIQIPDLVGTGEGLLGGLGGAGGDLLDLPDIGEVTIFGGNQSIGNDMRVSYYNLNLTRDGRVNPMSGDEGSEYEYVIQKYISSGFKKSVLAKYYRSPRSLYATTIMIPTAVSTVAPAAFNEDMNYGFYWCALFEGKLVHKDGITFRFWGASDDVLNVALDGELVLAANFNQSKIYASGWRSPAPYTTQILGNTYRVGSDWITLEPGVARDLTVIVGENAGGEFAAQLLVEVEGKEYELNDRGSKIFEAFAMEPLSWELKDTIMLTLTEGEANVTNVTTIFRDY
jgi:hypothetical protein